MSSERTACVRMEEGYMRITVPYSGEGYRSEICDAIEAVENELDVSHEVIHRKDGENKGFFTVEFSGEDYSCNRVCGEFAEALIKKLDISACDID